MRREKDMFIFNLNVDKFYLVLGGIIREINVNFVDSNLIYNLYTDLYSYLKIVI